MKVRPYLGTAKRSINLLAASHICVGGYNIWYSGIVFGHWFLRLKLAKPEADGEARENLGGGILPLYRLTTVKRVTFGVLWKRPHFSRRFLGSNALGLSWRLSSPKRRSGWTYMLTIRRDSLSPVPSVRGCVPYMTT